MTDKDKKLFGSILLKKVNEINNRKDFVPASYIFINYDILKNN